MGNEGLLISLEGIDGCGKSSLIAYLNTKLDPKRLVNIREPGGTVLSEYIRDILLDNESNYNMTAETEALLYAAARSQVVSQNPISSCSKAPRGLSVLSQVTGIFTGITISPSPSSRQCPDRYAFRAGLNLPDKEFRYLRTVIVTAAVHRGFGSKLRPKTNLSP
jgi:hypothetical protein